MRAWLDRGCDCDPGPKNPLLTTSRSTPMFASISRFADRWTPAAFVLCFVYSLACASSLLFGWGGTRAAEFIGAWGTTPVELFALLLLWPLMRAASLTRLRRLAYRLLFGALVLDLAANLGWGYD